MPASASSRRNLALAVLVSVALIASACAAPAPAADGDHDLDVQLSWVLNEQWAGEYLASDRGYYQEEGLGEVRLVPGPSNGVAELVAGSADVAISDVVSIAAAIAREQAPLKIIGAALQKNPYTILSVAERPIRTPDDLVGRRIGVQDGNTALFTAFLAANGIDPADVQIVPVQYDPAPLTNGEVDGFVAYLTNEPLTVAAAGYDVMNLPFADFGLPFVGQVMATTEATLADDADALRAFLRAEVRGWGDQVADPALGVALAVKEYGADLQLDADKALASATATIPLMVTDETETAGLLTVSPALQQATVASLARAGIDITADHLFDLSLLDEVHEAAAG